MATTRRRMVYAKTRSSGSLKHIEMDTQDKYLRTIQLRNPKATMAENSRHVVSTISIICDHLVNDKIFLVKTLRLKKIPQPAGNTREFTSAASAPTESHKTQRTAAHTPTAGFRQYDIKTLHRITYITPPVLHKPCWSQHLYALNR
jgi:hypothetical protein